MLAAPVTGELFKGKNIDGVMNIVTADQEVEAELQRRGIDMFDVIRNTKDLFNKMKDRPVRGKKKLEAIVFCFYLSLVDNYPDRVDLTCRFFGLTIDQLAKLTKTQSRNARFDLMPVHVDPLTLVKGCWTRFYGTEDGHENVVTMLKRFLDADQARIDRRGKGEGYYTVIGAMSPIDLVVSTIYYYFCSSGFQIDKTEYLKKNDSKLTIESLTNICNQLRNIDATIVIR